MYLATALPPWSSVHHMLVSWLSNLDGNEWGLLLYAGLFGEVIMSIFLTIPYIPHLCRLFSRKSICCSSGYGCSMKMQQRSSSGGQAQLQRQSSYILPIMNGTTIMERAYINPFTVFLFIFLMQLVQLNNCNNLLPLYSGYVPFSKNKISVKAARLLIRCFHPKGWIRNE